jgi:hypothetical protein
MLHNQVKNMNDRVYSRKYFRVVPDPFIEAELSISRVDMKSAGMRTVIVPIHNISPGGLMFSSELFFPVYVDIIFRFSLVISGQNITLEGRIVHRRRSGGNLYNYGICFTQADKLIRPCLVKLFNNMLLKMHGRIVLLRFN